MSVCSTKYPWALRRLSEQGREVVQGIKKRFYNNLNSKTVKSVEELVSAMALLHSSLLQTTRRGVILG